jgi:hypothetical protein
MKKKIKYTAEPTDGMELPGDGFKVIPRSRQGAAGLPALDEPGTEYTRTESTNHISLTPERGGRRNGAGRKPSGHVRMQLLVSPATRKKIEALAKLRNVTLSEAVEQLAAMA